jgi:hypothetical protein
MERDVYDHEHESGRDVEDLPDYFTRLAGLTGPIEHGT